MTRSIPALVVLLSLSLAGSAEAARGRAVRHPSPQCSFSLSPGFATIAASGLSHGTIAVIGSPSTCTSWNAYSLTSWVTVTQSGSSALVDVAPNPTSTARTGTILVAGIRLEIRQDGSPVISPPVDDGNLLQNGTFNSDLGFWGWYTRFPNGQGTASWSSFDAANNGGSGSIRLINTVSGHTFQQLQCVAVEAGAVYEYGGKFFATSASNGTAMWTVFEYAVPDCSDDKQAVGSETQTPRIRTPATWQLQTYTKRMGPTTQSVLVVIGSRSTYAGAFEIFMDDVFLRRP